MPGNGFNRNNGRVWLSTADEIGQAIGRNRHEVPRLVKAEDLPAFKFYGKWTALPEDLSIWSHRMKQKYGTKEQRIEQSAPY